MLRIKNAAIAQLLVSGIFCVLAVLAAAPIFAQQNQEVKVKGFGTTKGEALQDAMRNAVTEVVGASLRSETQVENFAVIRDAIFTRTQGYVSNYTITKETKGKDGIFKVDMLARVSLDPLRADIQLLAQAIGGVRFLVMYDARSVPEEARDLYDFAVERINEALAQKRYRYIEKKRFDVLRDEAYMLMKDLPIGANTEESFVQQLGLRADAEFIINIRKISLASRSESFDTRVGTKVTIEARAYDNCTGEGLGTIYMESDWVSGRDLESATMGTVGQTVASQTHRLLLLFNQYIGDWVNNGTPYELRFYGVGGFRDFRDLRNKLRDDGQFGGQLQMTAVHNYTRLNTSFRNQPDELAYKILDYADEIPALREKVLDVKLIYGRQINFAPQSMIVPELLAAPQITTTPEDKK